MNKLFEKNRTEYCIHCDMDDMVLLNGATILSEKLTQISGAFFLITIENATKNIFISYDEKLAVKNDGFCIEIADEYIKISAKNGRGIIYGIYEFLQHYLGCKFVAIDAIFIPKLTEYILINEKYSYSPKLEYRDIALYDYFSTDISMPNKLNGEYSHANKLFGGIYKIMPFAHSLTSFVPVKEFFESNPEYFPLINGQRIRSYSQLCFSNEEIVDITVEKLKKMIIENPAVKIFSVSQSDGYNWCECENCMKINDKLETLGGSMFEFINNVAKKIKEYDNSVFIDTLAYLHTRKPPKGFKMEENVIIRYCNIEASIVKPLGDNNFINLNNFDKSYLPVTHYEEISQWKQVVKKVFVWNYPYNGAHTLIPIPNLNCVAADIKNQIKAGVEGIFLNMSYLAPNTSFAQIKGYVFSNLLFNDDLDMDKLLLDATNIYYGKAGEYMLKAINYMEERAKNPLFNMGVFCPAPSEFYNDELCDTLENIYDDALKVCENETYTTRVKRELLTLENVRLIHKASNDSDFSLRLQKFFEETSNCGQSNYKEMTGIFEECKKQYAEKLTTKNWYGGEWQLSE